MGRFARLDSPLPLYEVVHRIKQHLDQTHVRLAMSHKHTRGLLTIFSNFLVKIFYFQN
jgi:hypothetical protein